MCADVRKLAFILNSTGLVVETAFESLRPFEGILLDREETTTKTTTL